MNRGLAMTEFERITNKAIDLYAKSVAAKKTDLHFVLIGMAGELLRSSRRNPTVDDLINSIKRNQTYATMPDLKAAAIEWINSERE